ncbi:uncharacterized protein LOC106717918 [Papilio machaon]|uniref:uncharacterized protein LOC106717918 n=1 Tax=Papilio machaon TaxID=76193 RepID=UPI001E663572|nr:uncharacterized protein LOC106717918 [Papilio machaon]
MENVSAFCGTNMEDALCLSEREFTSYFISIYRELPTLWNTKSRDYTDKHKRKIALTKMTNLLKMIRPNITENDVKKKINILRTSYKREENKIIKSMASGSQDSYVPSLWYYNHLQFLHEEDGEDGEKEISIILDQQESSSSHSSISSPLKSSQPVQRKKKKKDDSQHNFMMLDRDHVKRPENEYEVMATNWAYKLERMTANQRRLAEKFINEILFEGEEGNLNRHSVVINPNSTQSISSTPLITIQSSENPISQKSLVPPKQTT